MKAILHTTYSYWRAIELASEIISNAGDSLKTRNFIFTPEKNTLILESLITEKTGGYLNTRVFSFGKYLKYFMPNGTVLKREGSVMAIKKIIGENESALKCFKVRSVGIAENLYDSIALLKSAKVNPSEVLSASNSVDGVLKDKLCDLALIFGKYEEYLGNGYYDQSAMLSCIPELLENDKDIKNTNVYLVGFDSWTAQARAIVETLIKNAKSVTAVSVYGENDGVYINETATAFISIAKSLSVTPTVFETEKPLLKEHSALLAGLYSEKAYSAVPIKSEKVKLFEAPDIKSEVEFFVKKIKKQVVDFGARYSDFAIAVSDDKRYSQAIESVFYDYGVPYYFDKKKKFSSHPLSHLIIDFLEVNRKNFKREEVLNLIKNPLFCFDKNLADEFENFVIYKNIKFDKFLTPFNTSVKEVEALREKLVSSRFNANGMMKVDRLIDIIEEFCDKIGVKDTLNKASEILAESDPVYADYTLKAYSVLEEILQTARVVLCGVSLSVKDFALILLSAFNASEITIIPSVNDAVFIGGYRECGGAKKKTLFALGLNGNAPEIKQDIAVLSDGDITKLEQLKIIIEPKVSAVNAREREVFSTALTAFSDELYLSYSLENIDGKALKKSDILNYIEKIFSLKAKSVRQENALKADLIDYADDYLYSKSAEKSFALDIGSFKEKISNDITAPTAYYYALNDTLGEDNIAKELLENIKTEVVSVAENAKNLTVKDKVSVTTIEKFYSCPFRCFMESGIGISERKVGEIKPNDSGNFLHAFTELYAKSFANNEITSLSKSDEKAKEILLELSKIEEFARFKEDLETDNALTRLIEEGVRLSRELYYQLTNTEFKVLEAEAEFGEGKKYPPIILKTDACDIKVRGKIDRIDKSDKYYRIIDYKTGSANASDAELFVGKKVQTYLYLNAFKTDESVPAGSYYFKVSDDYSSSEEKDPQLIGKTIGTMEVFSKTDTALKTGEKSRIIKGKIDTKGNLSKINTFISEEGMVARMEYAKRVCEKGVQFIKDGFVLATPFVTSRSSTCDYCPYGAVCGYEEDISGVGRKELNISEKTIIQAVNDKGEEDAT
ncbi:MAG: PD-(D/E)XK nuclease family protein [Clostridia bacterium]|nr:PD-(D/E)XK nuclease family protein [Clostridia bacterium]